MSFGLFLFSQLGNNKTVLGNPIPCLVKLPEKGLRVVGVAAGFAFSAAMTDQGRVFVWGKQLSHLALTRQPSLIFGMGTVLKAISKDLVPGEQIDYADQLIPLEIKLPQNRRAIEIVCT